MCVCACVHVCVCLCFAMLGTSCLVEFCIPCVTVEHFEYAVSDLNYTNINSITKAEISNPLKISRSATFKQ